MTYPPIHNEDEVTPVEDEGDLYDHETDPKVLRQALQEFRSVLTKTARERDHLRADLQLAEHANEELKAAYSSIEAALKLRSLALESMRVDLDAHQQALKTIEKYIKSVLRGE